MGPLVALLWFLRTTRALLFWLSLWQLKEYHIGRLVDHFRTANGKRVAFNQVTAAKLLVFLILFTPFWGLGALLLAVGYTLEAGQGVRLLAAKGLLLPVFTRKVLALLGAGLALETAILAVPSFFSLNIYRVLLGADLLFPLLVSALVLGLQPFAVLGRRRMLQEARRKRAELGTLKVVGVTGSYGKTSTKEFLAALLFTKFKTAKTKEHQNSEVGIARALLEDVTSDHEVFVVEMGAYNKGGVGLLADIARPTAAVLTGANEQHLATFGSVENLLSAEGGEELVAALPEGAPVAVNQDSPMLREGVEKYQGKYNREYVWCLGSAKARLARTKADVWAENVRATKERISFTARTKEGNSAKIHVNVLGKHNVENLLLAIAAARQLGMELDEIAKACSNITPDLGALKLKEGKGGLHVVDSVYSANPDGVLADLEYLKTWKGKRAVVMPCLIELGSAAKEAHERIGRKIGEICDLACITTSDHFPEIQKGAVAAGMAKDKVQLLPDAQAIYRKLQLFRGEEDIVLLEGGKESRTQRALLRVLTE